MSMSAAFAAAAAEPTATAVRTETDVAYADRPGCVLDVRVPEDATNFPTVVWFHAGGLTGGSRHFLALADAGIAQVAADYRLLGRDAATGEDCIADAAAAVAWTLARVADWGGDTNRVFVAGHSAGGYLAMMVGMNPKWLAAHGVKNTALAGVVAVSGQATTHFAVRKFSGDDDPQFRPRIDALAPLAHVSADLPPILCICGQPPFEWKARAEENRFLVASCEALGHPAARYVELPRCDHSHAAAASLPYLERFVREGRLP